MAHPALKVESLDGSTQVTIDGLLQMTVLSDGSVQIDLAGKQIEVERHMDQGCLIIRHERTHDSTFERLYRLQSSPPASAAPFLERSQMTTTIDTPGGYIYEEPEVTGQPDVSISLPFAEAYDVLLDGITNEATIEPITEPTFKLLAYNLLHLLIDASDPDEEGAVAAE